MPEIVIQIFESVLATAKKFWGRFAGIPDYEVQESRVRVPGPRWVVYMNSRLRRSSSSGHDCRF